jgi:hypothetical protein
MLVVQVQETSQEEHSEEALCIKNKRLEDEVQVITEHTYMDTVALLLVLAQLLLSLRLLLFLCCASIS